MVVTKIYKNIVLRKLMISESKIYNRHRGTALVEGEHRTRRIRKDKHNWATSMRLERQVFNDFSI